MDTCPITQLLRELAVCKVIYELVELYYAVKVTVNPTG